MPHDIFGERLGSLREVPWHELGQVFDGEVSAVKAYEEIGAYRVETVPTYAEIEVDGRKKKIATGGQQIVRWPTPDDDEFRFFGDTGPDYVLLDPLTSCTIWDERTAAPVETIGSLGKGETFFLTTRLPAYDVFGDEIENYLLFDSPMTGRDAASLRITPVRTVCRNTLELARSFSVQTYRIVHNANARDLLGDWLAFAYETAIANSEVIKEAFEVLAKAKVRKTSPEIDYVLETAYPDPTAPSLNAPESVLKERTRRWEAKKNRLANYRASAKGLFLDGSGRGLDEAPAKMTVWGLFNAVTETENYRKGTGSDDAVSVAENILAGKRASAMERAFDASLEVAKELVK